MRTRIYRYIAERLYLLRLKLGEDADPEEIKRRLTLMGYERVSMIESRGEYSIRGGIIDIFTPDSDDPYRVELFDTEVDSIRTFDSLTQRSDHHCFSLHTAGKSLPPAAVCRYCAY